MQINAAFFHGDRQKVNAHAMQIDYENCVSRVQNYIADNSTDLYDSMSGDMSHAERRKKLVQCINDYINKYRPVVVEYLDSEGVMNNSRLLSRLIDEIVNYDILTDAMTDDHITEIRINNGIIPGGIWVEKNGISRDLRHMITGEPLFFKDVTSVNKFINNLLKFSKTTMSVTESLVNGTTIEGYRIAATDAYATAREKGSTEKSPSCVIRKFSSEKLTLSDLVTKRSISGDMARFLSALPKVDLTAVSVGSTGCGKTVLLQAMLMNAPLNKRIVLIQNPAEIDVSVKNANGVELRDFISWEAKDIRGDLTKKTSTPTYQNLMNHSLRSSPQIFIFGELRSDAEFALSMEAAASGHYFYTTFHAEDAQGAIDRYTTAVLASGGNSSESLVKSTICDKVRFIIVQRRLADGTRKVISINEICGVSKANGLVEPIINPIFKFIPDESGERDENGFIKGKHAQVGTVSDRTKEQLLLSGAAREEIDVIKRKASVEEPIYGDYNIFRTKPQGDKDNV